MEKLLLPRPSELRAVTLTKLPCRSLLLYSHARHSASTTML